MDCLHTTRLLLARSAARSYERMAHLVTCRECTRLARELDAFERLVEDAVIVALPDDLEHRILLRCRRERSWGRSIVAQFARAAAGHVERLFAALSRRGS